MINRLILLYHTKIGYGKVCNMQNLIYDFYDYNGCNKCSKDTVSSCCYFREGFL